MLVSFEFDADRHLVVAPMTHGANTLIMLIFAVGGTSFSPRTKPRRDHKRHSDIARDNCLCAANIAVYDDGRRSFG